MQLTFPADGARLERLRSEAHRVLAGNWRHGSLADGTPYGFTCPAPPRYRHQWYWDSCFHAIVWRHFDPARAREELRTLLRGGRLDGFIPHTIFWHDNAGWRRAPFYATHSVRGNRATAHIQTPFLAVAWELVAAASEDEPGFAAEGLDALRLHYDWLDRHRDPDGDGLISIIHPDESGLDDSPKYDAVFGWMTHYRPGYFWLVERSRRLRYDSHAIIARYDEHVEDVLVNVVYALSLRAMARLTGDDEYRLRAERTERALLELCWDEERGLFWDVAGRGHAPQRVSTWSSLAPLALPSLPERIARRLSRSTCSTPAASEPRSRSRRCRWRSRASGPDGTYSDAGAGRRGSTPCGSWPRRCAASATPRRPIESSARASSWSSVTASASTTTRSRAMVWPRDGSAGRPFWSTSCPRPRTAPARTPTRRFAAASATSSGRWEPRRRARRDAGWAVRSGLVTHACV
ncbi:MAG: hypothetical protein WAL38_11890, partial [Solirubrobacteraceae bacterium]